MKTVFRSDRDFVVTDAYPSHAQLLLRSIRDERYPKNQDLLFKGVSLIDLPWRLSGVSIDVIGGQVGQERVYSVVSDGHSFRVVAEELLVSENELPRAQTTIEFATSWLRDVFVISTVIQIDEFTWRVLGVASAEIRSRQSVLVQTGPEREAFFVIEIVQQGSVIAAAKSGASCELTLTNRIGTVMTFPGVPRSLKPNRALMAELPGEAPGRSATTGLIPHS